MSLGEGPPTSVHGLRRFKLASSDRELQPLTDVNGRVSRSTSRRVLVLLFVTLEACSGSGPSATRTTPSVIDSPPTARPVPLQPTPSGVLAGCLRVEPAITCPRSLPRVDSQYRGRTLDVSPDYHLFDIAAGGPYPGINRKNAPPRFAHIVIKAGDLSHGFYFPFPDPESSPTSIHQSIGGSNPVFLGKATWGGKSGVLVLAPPFPAGGIDGDHLIFRWTEGHEKISISLHTWKPLAMSEATLHAVVESVE
jgi:hypothetical protein